MTRRRSRVLGGLVWGVVAVDIAAVVSVAIGILPAVPGTPDGGAAIFVFLTAAFGIVACRVVVAQPGNRVGWLLWIQPTCLALSGAGQSYAVLSIQQAGGTWPGTALLAWLGGLALLLFIAITVLLIPLVFPDGNLPSRRWRPAAVIVALAAITTVVASGGMFTPGALSGFPGVDNPLGLPGGEVIQEFGGPLNALLIFIGLPIAIAAVTTRFRRGTPVERQQVKWFTVGITVPALLLVASLALQSVTLVWALTILAMGLIPVVIGVAILRYRLFEIDRIVSRGLSWAILSGLLVAVYAGAVLLLEGLLAGMTQGATLAVAASTLLAAALFQPLRLRLHRTMDRRFDRARYDGEQIAEAFAALQRDEVDLAGLQADIRATVAAALRPSSTAVWIRDAVARSR